MALQPFGGELVADVHAGGIEGIVVEHETRGGIGVAEVGYPLEGSLVARLFPTVVEHAAVGIVKGIDVFHLIGQCAVVGLTAEFVTEDEVYGEAFPTYVGVDGALQFRFSHAAGYLVFGVPCEGFRAVAFHIDFLSRGRVDAFGRHSIDGVHRFAFAVLEAGVVGILRRELVVQFLQGVGDFLHLVFVVSGFHADRPTEITLHIADELCLEGDFVTTVLHLAHVGLVAAESAGDGQVDVGQQVVGDFVVPVEADVEAAVEHLQIHADVQLAGFLPFQVGVTVSHQIGSIPALGTLASVVLIGADGEVR